MDVKVQRLLAVAISGVALTMVRRWRNKDPQAGYGVAGWTVVAMLYVLTS